MTYSGPEEKHVKSKMRETIEIFLKPGHIQVLNPHKAINTV